MHLFNTEVIDQSEQVTGEILKFKGAFIIVAIAVATGVSGHRMELLGKRLNLPGPISAVAADPM